MKKALFALVLVGAITLVAVKLLQSPPPPAKNTPPAAHTVATTATPAPTLQPATPPPESAPALPSPAATPVPPATASSTSATPVAASATKNPKTLNELYRAFDVINAAAEATTAESIATLVDFAATENPDVRSAALNAIINRNDVTAAPLLRKAAKQLDDSKAIIALLETADYIELPSTTMTALAALPKTPKAPKLGEHPPATAIPLTPPTASP